MNILFTNNGLRIGRDTTDKPIYKESTVIYRLLKMLNHGNFTRHKWVRFTPEKAGNLTSCRIGIRHNKTGDIYWHGNYQIESANGAFNDGSLFLNKA